MAQLVDLFAYLSVLLRGAVLVLQSLAVGGVAFELLVLRPSSDQARPSGTESSPRRMVPWAAAGLAAAWLFWLALDSAVLVASSDLGPADVLGASYFLTGSLVIVCALTLAVLSFRVGVPGGWLVLPALGVLLGSTATSHAGARLEDRPLLLSLTFLHQTAVALWIGGLPSLWSTV